MRLKLFILFIGIQLFSFEIWNTLPDTQTKEISAIHTSAEEATSHIHFSAKNKTEETGVTTLEERKELTKAVLKTLPYNHVQSIKNIILDYNEKASRGLGGGNVIVMRNVNMGEKEFGSVLVHETGHTVDYGYLKPKNNLIPSEFKDGDETLYETDPSLDFYRISWKNEKEHKRGISNLDFVSGYAMTDCFEDFAESYVFYVLHNQTFKKLAENNKALQAKYEFMRDKVFKGESFETGESEVRQNSRPWDITLLSYNLNF